jgi:hypothetical protein
MSSATILFCDVVGFSRKSGKLQREIVESLTSEVSYFIRKYHLKPFKDTEVVALPTGDGIALAFLHSNHQSWKAESIVHLSFCLHQWAGSQRDIPEILRLRIGIHVGSVDFVVDINGATNICGDCINTSQRIMDAANPAQTLMSDAAFRHYFGNDNAPIAFKLDGSTNVTKAGNAIETYAKHGVRLLVHSLVVEPPQDWYSCLEPYSKNVMLISQTPLPKEIVGDFSKRLESAKEVALVQINGERLLSRLEAGDVVLNPKIERLWVFMPDISIADDTNFGNIVVGERDIGMMVARWKRFLEEVRKQRRLADVRLILVGQPSYFGAAFIDWTSSGGRIHVSPYIWNLPATSCPGYELDWIGSEMPSVYKAYVSGIEYLCEVGRREI